MRQLSLFLLIPVFLILSCQDEDPVNYNSYPRLKAVVAEFEKKIRIKPDLNTYLELAKKPAGWFIVRKNRKGQQVSDEYLFWNAKTGQYETPSVQGKNPDKDADGNETLSEILSKAYNYDHSIYFGYEGWDDDVIGELEGKTLNDTLNESLARAYNSKSMKISRSFDGKTKKENLSDKEAEEFSSWCDKEIAVYETMQKLNPQYHTMIGNVSVKLGNTCMYAWSELNVAGHKDKAAKFLRDNLYEDIELNFAKNILIGAEQNAIIFTMGDNDTYPVWYAQEKLGVRKDVSVINATLLNVPQWILYCNAEDKLGLFLGEHIYVDSLSEYFEVDPSTNIEEISFYELAKGFTIESPLYYSQTSPTPLLVCPSKNLRLNDPDSSAALTAHFGSGKYLTRSDLVLMDIICTNYGKRPVYFGSNTQHNEVKNALQSDLVSQGMLNKISTDAGNSGSKFFNENYDLNLLHKNLTSTYSYGMNAGSQPGNVIAGTYFYLFNALVTLQLEKQDTAGAKSSLDYLDKNLFPEKMATPLMLILTGCNHLYAGETAKGENMLRLVIGQMRKDKDSQSDEFDADSYINWLNYINEAATKSNLSAIVAESTKLRDEIAAMKK